MSFDRYASDTAARAIKSVFPQTIPLPWKGAEGAEASCPTVNHGVMKVCLYKNGGSWWAEASGRADATPLSEVASSALEAARKLKKALLA